MKSTDKRYSTKTEIAALLRISPTTLNRLTKSGAIKCFKVGRLVRFDTNDLFLSKTKDEPPAHSHRA